MRSIADYERWETPLSAASFVTMTSLTDDGALTLTFQSQCATETSLMCFRFTKPTKYALTRGNKFLKSQLVGRTMICGHELCYLIYADNAMIEVISSMPPETVRLGKQHFSKSQAGAGDELQQWESLIARIKDCGWYT